jgi:hypothetical protein
LQSNEVCNSISSVISGIAAQEVVKAITSGEAYDKIYTYDGENQNGIFY